MWDRYKPSMSSARAAVLLAQTLLIAGLLVQRAAAPGRRSSCAGARRAARRVTIGIRDLGARVARRTGNGALAHRARAARRHQPADGAARDGPRVLAVRGSGRSGDLAGEVCIARSGIAQSVHDLSHRLHPAKLRLIGLSPRWTGCDANCRRPALAITLTHHDVPRAPARSDAVPVPGRAGSAAERPQAQPCARLCRLSLRGVRRGCARPSDDGTGFDVDAAWGKGLGLVSMANGSRRSAALANFIRNPASALGSRSSRRSAPSRVPTPSPSDGARGIFVADSA